MRAIFPNFFSFTWEITVILPSIASHKSQQEPCFMGQSYLTQFDCWSSFLNSRADDLWIIKDDYMITDHVLHRHVSQWKPPKLHPELRIWTQNNYKSQLVYERHQWYAVVPLEAKGSWRKTLKQQVSEQSFLFPFSRNWFWMKYIGLVLP